ncbi:MAG: isochorismatase family protein [Deltaproteobacteria bacterium]|nr:isochorismatase family protein [Deltaproteobacteria bacterium]
MRLERSKAAVLVVDVQERMVAAMDPSRMARLVNRTRALIEGAQALGLPLIVTEQYTRGLGATVAEVARAFPEGLRPVEKLEFSCAVPAVMEQLGGRLQVLLCGMEAHVCVFQTARDLLERGRVPYLCADALLSRNEEDRRLGIERARELGAVVTTVEGALFDLLGKAGTPEFKRISAAVR